MNWDKLLHRAVAETIREEELKNLLSSGKRLRLKEGLDPSAPDIHLGHMVALRKLREFQELGHQVVLIIGDWTAQIGDPSGVSATRPMLSAEQVKANAQTYMQQFFKIVDPQKTTVRWQSEWYNKFTLSDLIHLTSKFTLAQLLAREDFSKRYSQGKPISLSEFIYPLLQAYDSVAVAADVEFGGTDQKFNFLLARELQEAMGQPPQQIVLVPILPGTDGYQKMSKSLGNYIGITEPPEDIFGKIMSLPDHVILTYFELLTDVPGEELTQMHHQMEEGQVNPMDYKKRLAKEITTQLYSRESAVKAEDYFTRTVQKRELPDDIPSYVIPLTDFLSRSSENGIPSYDVSRIIVATGQASSRSEALRLIEQGAVSIDGTKVPANSTLVRHGAIIKVGKRRFARILDSANMSE